MKRLMVASAFVVTTASLFLTCDELKNEQNDTTTTQSDSRDELKNEQNDTTTPSDQSESTETTRIRTDSGLEYEIIQEGSGDSPQPGNLLNVHYTGWLNSNGEPGQEFDSSIKRNKPYYFRIGRGHVIKGWDEGVMGMKVGEKRRLFIPSHLAYGPRSVGPVIRANSNLIFDVELLGVKVT